MNQADKYITILEKQHLYDKSTFKNKLEDYPIIENLYKKCKLYKKDIIKNINIDIEEHSNISLDSLYKYLDTPFISSDIKEECIRTIKKVDTYIFTYKTNTFTFYNCLFPNIKKNISYKQIIVMACYGFIIMEMYNKQNISIPVYLFPSSYKKIIPNTPPVKVDNINSGYTSFKHNKSEYIVLFRKEDIENVFVHECIHFFNIDKGLFLNQDIDLLYDLLPIQSEIFLMEAYTEILTIIYISLCNAIFLNMDYKTILYNEWIYSLIQSNKLLQLYSINDISEFNKWYDKTNVFSYVFIKTLCFENISLFLHLFFDYTRITEKNFILFIKNSYKNVEPYLYKNKKLSSKFLNTTLKKSIYNIKW